MSYKKPRAEMTPEERVKVRQQDYASAIRRAGGRGGLVSNEAVRKRLCHLIDVKNIPARFIARRAEVTEAMVFAHYFGRRNPSDPPLLKCTRDFEEKILAARFTGSDQYWIPAVGSHRRVQALVCKGYTYTFLAAQLGYTVKCFHRKFVTDPRERICAPFARDVTALYEKLADSDPVAMGVLPRDATYARNIAAKRHFAPGHCWDDDAIDDPAAIPEWTGACGTEEGYRIHIRETVLRRNRMPPCMPCREAVETRKYTPDSFVFNHDRFAELLGQQPSIKKLADRLGISDCALHKWRQGAYGPRYRSEVEALAEALRVDVAELLTEDPRERAKAGRPPAPGQFNQHAVRVALDIARIPQSKAADLCGVSHTAMANWLCGRSKPTEKSKLQGLADAVGVYVETFFGYE